jgi:hypothetical protein
MKEHELNPKDFILDEIESIELMGELPTVDITVDETHMFFANDIYTHNSALDEDIIQANNISDSYRKIMTADFVMSLSRKVQDKVSNTARIHIIKNRIGPDGQTFPSKMNAGCGDIQIFSENSREGMSVLNEMNQGENVVKKMMSGKWNSHMNVEDSE